MERNRRQVIGAGGAGVVAVLATATGGLGSGAPALAATPSGSLYVYPAGIFPGQVLAVQNSEQPFLGGPTLVTGEMIGSPNGCFDISTSAGPQPVATVFGLQAVGQTDASSVSIPLTYTDTNEVDPNPAPVWNGTVTIPADTAPGDYELALYCNDEYLWTTAVVVLPPIEVITGSTDLMLASADLAGSSGTVIPTNPSLSASTRLTPLACEVDSVTRIGVTTADGLPAIGLQPAGTGNTATFTRGVGWTYPDLTPLPYTDTGTADDVPTGTWDGELVLPDTLTPGDYELALYCNNYQFIAPFTVLEIPPPTTTTTLAPTTTVAPTTTTTLAPTTVAPTTAGPTTEPTTPPTTEAQPDPTTQLPATGGTTGPARLAAAALAAGLACIAIARRRGVA